MKSTRRSFIATIGSITAVAGCLTKSQNKPKIATARNDISVEDDYEYLIDSVVGIGGAVDNTPKGTGWVIDNDKVVTNEHVISNRDDVNIWTYDDGWISANVVSTDKMIDTAVITPENKEFDNELSVSSSNPPIGEQVTTVGFPNNHKYIAKFTNVVGLNGTYQNQYDKTLPDILYLPGRLGKGSSGSPVINKNEKVIGMVGAGTDTSTFAISAELLSRVLPEIIEGGSYEHPYLGGEFSTVNREIIDDHDLDVGYGVFVNEVDDNGPLSGFDERVITQIDNRKVRHRGELLSKIYTEYSPGDEVKFTTTTKQRNKETETVKLGVHTVTKQY